MSMEYCEKCHKHIDTDFDAEHFECEEHKLAEQMLKTQIALIDAYDSN